MKARHLTALMLVGAAGCATSPWPPYESAVRCHLDGKKAECEQFYVQAIKADPMVQGIHASYGMHLLSEGKVQEAEREFQIETKNYPMFAAVAVSRLSKKNEAVATETPAPAVAPEAPSPAPEAPAANGGSK